VVRTWLESPTSSAVISTATIRSPSAHDTRTRLGALRSTVGFHPSFDSMCTSSTPSTYWASTDPASAATTVRW